VFSIHSFRDPKTPVLNTFNPRFLGGVSLASTPWVDFLGGVSLASTPWVDFLGGVSLGWGVSLP
jgi:hypothetical protein